MRYINALFFSIIFVALTYAMTNQKISRHLSFPDFYSCSTHSLKDNTYQLQKNKIEIGKNRYQKQIAELKSRITILETTLLDYYTIVQLLKNRAQGFEDQISELKYEKIKIQCDLLSLRLAHQEELEKIHTHYQTFYSSHINFGLMIKILGVHKELHHYHWLLAKKTLDSEKILDRDMPVISKKINKKKLHSFFNHPLIIGAAAIFLYKTTESLFPKIINVSSLVGDFFMHNLKRVKN